jgi:hypothetical protein
MRAPPRPAMRKRGEMVVRSFAHALDRGGMRRAWLRGRQNVDKRAFCETGRPISGRHLVYLDWRGVDETRTNPARLCSRPRGGGEMRGPSAADAYT